MADGATPVWADVVCVAEAQVSSLVGDEVAILGLDQGTYYGLNPTGTRIWEMLQKPIRVDEICATILQEYEVDEETARRDLLEVLARLREAGLIEVRRADRP